MKEDKSGGKSLKKTILAGALLIGSSTFLFQGLTQAAMTVELGKTCKFPTSYTSYMNRSNPATVNNLPAGYQKAHYSVKAIDLEYYRNQSPTTKDMNKEAAAEIGAQSLWKVFNLNLEGQVIEMGYQSATASLPRTSWHGDVLINGQRSYCFSVDSVTGELLDISRNRTLNKNVSLAFDASLAKNPQEYVGLAQKLAKEYNVVHSAVKSVEYNGQGYSNNDPDISLDITGENGEIALMTFSRYDKALLGVAYNSEYKPSREYAEGYAREMQKKAEDMRKSAPSADPSEAPSLMVLQ